LIRSSATLSFFGAGLATVIAANSPEENAWADVLRLDAGPREQRTAPKQTAAALKDRYLAHLSAQEKALIKYLLSSPAVPRLFEARFRLARVLALKAEIENDPKKTQQASDLLSSLENEATPEQKSHIAFTRLTQTMRLQRFPTKEQREGLLLSVKAFQASYPTDPRAAGLLTEVATRFDSEPRLKKTILEEAAALSTDPRLQLRIKDDLKRTALLGKPLRFSISKLSGGVLNLDTLKGDPVVLFYFSEDSVPSLVAWESLNEGLQAHPKIQRVAISLDKKIHSTQTVTKEYGASWLVCWDGLSWNSPVARAYGINAVPTAWYLDPQGKVQSLNLLEDLPAQLLSLENNR